MPAKEYVLDASYNTKTGQVIGGAGGVAYFEGDHASLVFTVTDLDGKPIDVSSWSISFDATDGSNTLGKTVSGGDVSITTAAAGIVTVGIGSSDTSGNGATTFDWVFTVTSNGNSNQFVLAEGTWNVQASEEN